MRKLILCLLLIGVTAMTVNAQTIKIGYVDKAKALTELEAWKNADSQLMSMKDAAEFELAGMLREADSLGNLLQNQMMLTEASKVGIQGRITQLSQDYQRIGAMRQNELIERESALKTPILEAFEVVIRDLGIKEDYTIIYDVNVNSILFTAGGRDLTEQVLFELRKTYK